MQTSQFSTSRRLLRKTTTAMALGYMMAGDLSHAATFLVNRGIDGDITGCTLRNAINIINNNGTGIPSLCLNQSTDAIGQNDTILIGVSNLTDINTPLTVSRCMNINPNGSQVRLFGTENSGLMEIDTSGSSCPLANNEIQNVRINNMTFSNGGGEDGGALHIIASDVEINQSVFENNSATNGGGIYADTGTILTITNSLIKNNTSLHGGGIFATSNSTTVTMNNTQISENTATNPDGSGGGVHVAGATFESNNSEISANQATHIGGGVYVEDTSSVVFNNTTLSANEARAGGGLAMINNDGNFTCNYSTISDNRATDNVIGVGGGIFSSFDLGMVINSCVIAGNTRVNVDNPSGEIFLQGFGDEGLQFTGTNVLGEISQSSESAFGSLTPLLRQNDIIATSNGNTPTALDSILSPLADNGGITRTHALPENSPAIDRASGASCASIVSNVDQLGQERPSGSACDIGAFEFQQQSSSFFVIPVGNGKSVIINL